MSRSLPRGAGRMVDRLVGRRRSARDLTVREGMSGDPLVVGRDRTMSEATHAMVDRDVRSALVEPAAAGSPPGILTVRDVVRFVAEGRDPARERVGDHCTREATVVEPGSRLDQAAGLMSDHAFRHLPVVDDGETVGIIAIRDVVRCLLEWRAAPPVMIPIADAMSRDIVSVGQDASLRDGAEVLNEHEVGAAVVDTERPRPYPRIVTEREVLAAVGRGADPDRVQVGERLAKGITFSASGWSLQQAAEAMTKGGFQHVLVVEPDGIAGMISMRDVLRRWSEHEREGSEQEE